MGPITRGPFLIARFLQRALTVAGTILGAGALFAVAGAVESIHPAAVEVRPSVSPALERVSPGDTVARLSVPRLGLEAAVREGVDADTLFFGPGHVPGTALPGEESRGKNSVIAVARDVGTSFTSELTRGDVLELRTPFGLRSYRVVERRVLRIEDLSIRPTDEPSLTLLSAYPPDSVGPAPLRLAVRAVPFEPGPAKARTSSATRSTGWISTLVTPVVSIALPDGR